MSSDGVIILMILLPASLYDLRYYRVPNQLIGASLLLTLMLRMAGEGPAGIISWGYSGGVYFLLTIILYRIGGLGAADIKLFTVVGSFYGVRHFIPVFVLTIFAGGLCSIGYLFLSGKFRSCFHRLLWNTKELQQTRQFHKYQQGSEKEGVIPFAICISLGTMGNLIYQQLL